MSNVEPPFTLGRVTDRKQVGPQRKPGASVSHPFPGDDSGVLLQLVPRYKVCDLASFDRRGLLKRCLDHERRE